MKVSSVPRRKITAAWLVPFAAAPIVAHGALDDVVVLWGESSDGPEMVTAALGARGGVPAGGRMTLEEACRRVVGLAARAGDIAAGSFGAVDSGDLLTDCEDSGSSGSVWFIFTTCSMHMGTETQWLRWTVPPEASEPEMLVMDTVSGEGRRVRLDTSLRLLEAVDVPTGDLADFSVSGPAATRRYTLNVSPDATEGTDREYTARQFQFSYTAEINPFLSGMDVPSGFEFVLPTVASQGEAWVASDVPGADVIRAFYANFRDHVLPAAGANSLMGGALRQMAMLASHGVPIETTQTTSMSMAGGAGILGGAMGADSTSTSRIDSIMVLPGASTGRCAPAVLPEEYEVVDLGEAMAGAFDSAGPGGAGPQGGQPPELAQAMTELQEAMSAMTPEERAAMEQLSGGLGALLGGVLSGERPSGGAAGGGAAPGQGQAATTVQPGSGGPSSAELMTDDLTQSAQNMLQALGYDPGNTEGEASLQTAIAVSQFQAEQGLEVTGEVTPQLVGILAAEVDARR